MLPLQKVLVVPTCTVARDTGGRIENSSTVTCRIDIHRASIIKFMNESHAAPAVTARVLALAVETTVSARVAVLNLERPRARRRDETSKGSMSSKQMHESGSRSGEHARMYAVPPECECI